MVSRKLVFWYQIQVNPFPMKRILLSIIFALDFCSAQAQQMTTFVFVRIEESIQPNARGSKYEDPLDSALNAANLGEVTGGGSSLSRDGKIEWVGIDVELTNVMRGIPFLRKKLVQLGAPKGSRLRYEFNGKKFDVPVHEGG